MSDAVMGGAWVEEKIARRHESVRMRLLRETHQRHMSQRRKRRDIARALLAAAAVLLGVVVVEMGRKATTLAIHAVAEQGNRSI